MPSFTDHFHPYLTFEEIAPYIDSPLTLGSPDTARVIEIVQGLPFEAAMRWTALVQRAVAARPPQREYQEALALGIWKAYRWRPLRASAAGL